MNGLLQTVLFILNWLYWPELPAPRTATPGIVIGRCPRKLISPNNAFTRRQAAASRIDSRQVRRLIDAKVLHEPWPGVLIALPPNGEVAGRVFGSTGGGRLTGKRGAWPWANPGVQPNSGNIPPQPMIRYCWTMEKRIVARHDHSVELRPKDEAGLGRSAEAGASERA